MPRILCLSLLLVLFSPSLRADPAASSSAPSTTIPAPPNPKSKKAAQVQDAYKECEKRVANMKGKPCDIIFIGDSITQNWLMGDAKLMRGKAVWEKNYANRNALNFGVNGDQTQNVLWRLDHMDVKGFTPKVAVILIGTNNFENKAEDIAAGIKAVIAKTEATFPGVKIILVSILPTFRSDDKMQAANAIAKTYADNQTVYYLDMRPLMPPVGNNWKGLGPDRLHPVEEGYEIYATALNPLLDKLLSEK